MQKFLRTLTLMALLVVPWVAQGQTDVTIGELSSATNDSYRPMNSLYDYSYSQQIYTADEIGMAGNIVSVTMWLYGNANLYEMPFNIYMVEVEQSEFASTTDWVTVTSSDIVYSGSVTVHNTEAQAYTFTLDVPFSYSGTGNLMIAFDNNTGDWKSGLNGKVFQSGTNNSMYARRDGTDYDPTNMSGIAATARDNKRNVILLSITPASGPSCTRPDDFAVSNITAHGADFSWISEVGNYTFEYKKASDENWNVVNNLSSTSYTLTNLDAATNYQARVKAVCGTDLESGWKTASFTTECIAITDFPWSEDFENYNAASFTAPCWVNEHIEGGGSNIFTINTSTQGGNSTKKLQLPDMTSGTMTKLVLPLMTLPADNYLFSIDVFRNASGTSYPQEGIRVYVSTDGEIDGATELAFISRNFTQTDGALIPAESASGWYTYELPLGISGNCYIILRGESKYGSATYMDNFIVKVMPNCLKPTLLTASNVTNNSITLSWDDNNNGSATYVITDGDDVDIPASQISNLTATGVTITGLNDNTLYSFKVKADCGEEYSDAVAINNIRTECDAMDLPWTCGFEADELYGTTNAEALPLCSRRLPSNVSNPYHPYASSSSTYAHESTRSLYFYGTTSSTYPETMGLVLPAVNVTSFPMNNNRVKFYARMANSTYNKTVDVYTTNNLTDLTEATPVGQVEVSGTTHTLYTVNLTAASANDAYVVLAVQRGSGTLYLDDLTLEVMPNCPDVTSVTATPNGLTAVVEWAANDNATGYAVELRQDEEVISSASVSATTHTFTDLTIDNDYQVYVRANCGSEQSPWSNPVSVHIGYCTPNPTSVDNQGITSLSFGGITNTTHNAVSGSAMYENFSSMVGSVPAGTTATVEITYATGYSYGTIIWVDWNNNMAFSGDEVVYAGVSDNINPTTLTATFDIPATQALGNYRMRILGADSYFDSYTGSLESAANANPCASYTWGVAEDYTIEVTAAPSCFPVANLEASNVAARTATLSWNADDRNDVATTYSVMNGETVIANGITETTYNVTGLDPETEYTLTVVANCSATDNASGVNVTFTTLEACPAPTALAQDGGFTKAADGTYSTNLTWTDNAGVSAFTVTATPTEGDAITVNATEANATLAGLTYGETYEVTVTANCGTDGTSNPSNTLNLYVGYCTPGTGNVDNDGIAKVTFGMGSEIVSNEADAVDYGDYSSMVGAIPASLDCNVEIIYATGYTYGTVVWVDWNNNLAFEGNEVVYVGTSTNSNPDTLTATFNIPETTPVGNYRMRIIGSDSGLDSYTGSLEDAANANPCGSYSWSTAHDYTLHVLEVPNCLPVAGLTVGTLTGTTAAISWTAGENDLSWDVYLNGEMVENVTTPAYTFENLEGLTAYTAGVVAKCLGSDAEVSTVSFTTPIDCGTADECEITIAGHDSYGDGWNGCAINIIYNDKVAGTFTLASGYDYTASYTVCKGQPLSFTWTKGGYGGETSWTITSSNGVVVNEGAGSTSMNTGDVILTVENPCPACFQPTNLTAEITSGTTATLTWTRDERNNGEETYTVMNGEDVVATGIDADNYVATIAAGNDYHFVVFATKSGDNSFAESIDLGLREIPTEAGKMVCVAGSILNNYNENTTVTLYRGLGENLTVQNSYTSSIYLTSNITNYTASNDWPVYGPMTIAYVGKNATLSNTGIAGLTPSYVCPTPQSTNTSVTANGAYTWTTPEGAEYTYDNHYTAALGQNVHGNIVATYGDTVRNVGQCDSIVNTLQLTLHPDFAIYVNDQFCQGSTYTVSNADGSEVHEYTASAQENVLLHTVYGADSLIVLNLQMNPSPAAYINNKVTTNVPNYCDNAAMVLNARSDMQGVTFLWEDESTDAVRTVYPNGTDVTYTLVAVDPTTGCQSPVPATVVVSTTPEPVLTISATATEKCNDGQNVTITVVDETNANATFTWSNGETGNSIVVNPTATTVYTANRENGCVNASATATVTVYPVYELNDVQSVCFTQNPYTWGDQTLTENGSYDQNFQTVNGCDSLVHLTFTFEEMSVNNTYRSVCEGAEVIWGAQTINATENTTLTYVDNSGECPAQYNLVLTVNSNAGTTETVSACDSYTWQYMDEPLTESNTYTVDYTDENGCAGVHTLTLAVHPTTYYEEFHQVCDATTYTWLDGETYNLDVELAEGVTYKTGEDEYGCDSIAQLHLDMNFVTDTLNWVNDTACDSYYLDVVNCDNSIVREYFEESGDIVRRTRNAATGRDRISRIHLVVNHSQYETVVKNECVPYTWQVTDDLAIDSIMNSVVLSQELTSAEGCPLIKVLRFTAKFPTESTTEVTLCQDGSWTSGNNDVYQMADYQVGVNEPVVWNTTTNTVGCDSVEKVVFTVNPVYNVTAELTYCESNFVQNYSQIVPVTYVNPNNAAESVELTIPANGLNQQVYTNTVTANWTTAAGCDSIVTINYTVNPSLYEEIYLTNCYSYTWTNGNGRTYTASTTIPATYKTTSVQYGCDSTAMLHLTITEVVNSYDTIEACGEYEYEGVTYRETMTFDVNAGQAASGCDSIHHITYNFTPRVMRDHYVTTNIPYTWVNGQTYTANADNIYYDATEPGGCDSILVLHLNMVNDTVVICENDVPYSGNGITINNVTVNIGEGFENGMPEDWTFVDNDGDGHNWIDYQLSWGNHYYVPNTGERSASSASYINGVGSLNTDNWMIMPQIPADQNTVLSWYSRVYQNDYPDSYTVMVSTTGNAPADFTDVVFNGNSETNNYTLHTVDLSSYAGQNIYVAFRHTDYDMYWLFIDDVNLKGSSVYTASENFHDTILYYVVNRNTTKETEVTVCDSYTWEENGETYTESGNYPITGLTNANGCDSTHTLALTVNYSSSTNATETVCDSYTWDVTGQTYVESGLYTYETTNAYGCEHIDTLVLTINHNNGTSETAVACNSYEWTYATTALTASGTYSADYTDLNGCDGVHTLNLTINNSTENTFDTIVNAASTYYNGNYYTDIREREGDYYNQPYTFDVLYENGNAAGCDSVDHVTLYVTRGEVHDTNANVCGNFTWNRNNHTYTWISVSERQANGNALYKDVTDNVYIHNGENPTAVVTNEMGVATHTYVLWLNMVEANYFDYDLGTVMLSDNASITVNPGDSLDTQTIDLTEYIAAKQNATLNVTLHHTSTYYCENVVTYTANLVYNYDTVAPVTVCDLTSWTDPVEGVHTVTIGAANDIDYVTADNWHHHVVVNVTARTNSDPQVEEACDTYTWTAGNGETYTSSTTANWNDDVNCTAETLQLTINTNAGSTETVTECDTYTWSAPDGEDYTYTEGGVYTKNFTDANGCVGTATLNLTINTNAGTTETETACDSYTWQYMAEPLTESNTYTVNYLDANNCEGVHTLNLTVNAHQDAELTDDACVTYTWADNNNAVYNESGDYTRSITDANGCAATETLHLTIYDTENTASERFEYGSGFTFHGHFYIPKIDGTDSTYTIVYDTVDVNNCAIKDTMTLHVSQYVFTYINKVECGTYTWTAAEHGNGHTYRVLTAEERAANPTAAFFDVTANEAKANMVQYLVDGNIYVLNLTINAPVVTVINASVPMSQLVSNNFTIDGRTIDCSEAVTAGATTVVTADFSMAQAGMGPFTACDSIVRYNVNVIYNYFTDDPVTLCAQTTYEVADGDVRTISLGENTLTFTINAGAANEEVHTVVVTNNDYTPAAPQVEEACDTYTWTAGNGETYTASTTANWNDDVNCTAETLQLTINTNAGSTETVTECDTYTWSAPDGEDYTYTEGGVYTKNFTDANGCVGTATLNLTINTNAGTIETETACDSYTWQYMAEPLTESDTYTVNYLDANNCEGVHTLNLTINAHQDAELTDDACVTYTWADNNNAEYTESGDYTRSITDANGCAATETLHLTINQHKSGAEEYWFGDGSYRYTGIHTAAAGQMYMPGDYTGISETVAGVAEGGCDSIYSITLHVGNNYTKTEAYRKCNTFTWERNGMTYTRLTADEAAANTNALYKDQDGNMITSNPTHLVEVENDYDSVFMLDLTLDAISEENVTIDFPVSLGVLNYAGRTFDYTVEDLVAAREFENETYGYELHLNANQYCDSIINLTVNVVNNYNHVEAEDADICMDATSYTWRDTTIITVNDNPNGGRKAYYIYDTIENAADSLLTVVDWIKVTQHPYAYGSEYRVECDSYDWNGHHLTESTSGITEILTDPYGCDSTVTLRLTINYSKAVTDEQVACDSYTWEGTTYTESTSDVRTLSTADGCDSVVTLNLTVNYSNSEEITVANCGPYTWNGTTYSQSGVYTYETTNSVNCDSVATLNLTVNAIPATVFDAPDEHVCDTFFWIGQTWNGIEMVDTTFDTITETAYSLTAYAYNEFGCPIEHKISAVFIDKSNGITEAVDCDSYTWTEGNGETYTESGVYTYTDETPNACGNPVYTLNLTINNNTSHADVVAICSSNLPAGGYEWNGDYYSTTGEYYYPYNAENGCASVDTLKLTVGNIRTFGREYVTNCGPYTWELTGETFTESAEASHILTAANAVGCDSVVMLYLTINPLTVTEATTCDNVPYTWSVNGETYTEAGTYSEPTLDENGNCVSEERLVLTVNATDATTLTDNVCLGNGYEANGFSIAATDLAEAGEYSFTLTTVNANNCDSVVTLNLTVNAPLAATQLVSNACESYDWNGETYTESGVYTYEYIDANNCVNVDTLHLTILNGSVMTDEQVACDSYTWEGTTYTESGEYTKKLGAANGCDSVVTLNLTVNYSNTGIDEQVACNRYEWIDGNTYTSSNNTATFTLENAAGCDSVVTLNLTVNYSNNYEFNDVACDNYTWNGATYAQSGDYTYAGTNVDGCDSVVTLHLTVNYSTAATFEATACDSYEWTAGNGVTYTESGNYTYTVTNSVGCDSVATLALTINNSNSEALAMTACDSYEWNGETYTESGVYTYETINSLGCDSVATLTLTVNASTEGADEATACDSYLWNGTTYTESGVYTYNTVNSVGCDSVATLTLTVNASTSETIDTAVCGSFTWTDGDGETYSTTGIRTFNTTNADGCAHQMTLMLSIKQPVYSTVNHTACDSYAWNGETYTVSGNYTYTTTAVNGCDSIVTLALTVNNSNAGTETATACDSYGWNGTIYTESGVYTYNTTNAAGCDSVATLTLTVNSSSSSEATVVNCGSYTWNGVVYSQSGIYTYNTINSVGCDSVATLTLTVNYSTILEPVTVAACGSYTWNGATYTQSGVYYDTTANELGCDNVAALMLTILQPVTSTINQTACDTYTWTNGTGAIYSQSGNYNYTYTAANGCDSVVTLALTINQSSSAAVTATACDSYGWNGNIYTESGVYTYNTINSVGCDSVAMLILTVNNASSESVTAEVCGSYAWNGQTYNQSGVYTYQGTNAAGCDSVVTLMLTIKQPITTTVNQTACDSYTWNGQTYTTSGNYTYNTTAANGCDSIVTLALTLNQSVASSFNESICYNTDYTWNGQTYAIAGQYQQTLTARNGCDSVVTLNLTVLPAVDQTATETACEAYTWTVNGMTYTESATYTAAITGENGCAATATLNLTVNQPLNTEVTVANCLNYEWNGQTYTESGVYTNSFTDANGCAAVATLNLTINPATSEVLTVTACDSYTWTNGNGETYTETPGYQLAYPTVNENGCPHTIYLLLTINNAVTADTAITAVGSYYWHGDTLTESGTYTYTATGSNGCDSTTVLTLTVQPLINYYTVTLVSANTSMGVVSQGDDHVAEGSLFTAVATPNNGYAFTGWSNESGATVSTEASYSFTVTSDITLTANFEYIPVYYTVDAHTVTVTVDNDTLIDQQGEILGRGEYESGANVSLTAVADSGYHFVRWSNGQSTATITFTVTGDINLIAYFEQDPVVPPTAVEDVDMSNVVIYSVDTKIIVRGVEGSDVYVFDVNGRMLERRLNAAEEVEFRMAATGVYLVKVGNAPAKRVLVVR